MDTDSDISIILFYHLLLYLLINFVIHTLIAYIVFNLFIIRNTTTSQSLSQNSNIIIKSYCTVTIYITNCGYVTLSALL